MPFTDPVTQSDRRSTLIALAIAAASGALWFLAAPSLDLWPLGWIAAAPLCYLVDRAPTPKRARRYAWLAGTVCSAGGFVWVVGLLTRYSSLPLPAALVALVGLAAYQGLVFWAFALAVRRIRDTSRERLGAPLPMALVAPVAMAAFETLWPMIFPYNLAITQAWQPLVLQLVELTGPVGVTALLFAAGGAVYDVLTETRLRRRAIPAAAAAAVIAAALIYGAVRIDQVEDARASAPELRVGLVQSNVPFDGPQAADDAFPLRRLRAIQDASAELQERGAQLIVWPESAFPFVLERRDLPRSADLVLRHRPLGGGEVEPDRAFTAPLVMGATTYEPPRDPDAPPYNSAYMVVGDRITDRFDKNHLVMFSEHIPGVETFPWLADILPQGSGHFTPGTRLATFDLPHQGRTYRLAPLVCFEDTLAVVTRELSGLRPHLLVNITNDTWFGDGAEPWQHLALSVFRAVEMRTDLVRAVNTGVTSHVDATGRVRHATGVIDPVATPREPEGHLVTVRLLEGGGGPFARAGNLFGWLCVIVTLAGWLAWPRIGRKRKRPAA